MKMLCVAAIVGMMSVAEAGEWDANLADFPRLAGETDDAPRFMRAVAAAPNGVLRVPKGEYDIASMIYITNRCSLSMHSAAHLVARAKMKYVLFWDGAADYHALSVFNQDGSIYDNANLFIKGGDIDGNGLASCLALANSHHFTLADITLHNGLVAGLCVTRETGGHLYELIANNIYCKCTMSGLAGNIGIDCQVADCHFTDCIIVDYTKGIRTSGGANRFTRCHVWGGTVPPKGMGFKEWSDAYARRKKMEAAHKWTKEDERAHLALGIPEMLPGSISFECIGVANVFDGCYADTAEIGYDIHNGAVIVNSGFYNNPRMNLRKSTVIVHRGGPLRVALGRFSGGANCEKLYEGSGKNVEWIANEVRGGAGMAEDAARLFAPRAEAAKYDVAAYVWPAYQPEPRWAELGIFADGKGEWQNVYESTKRTPDDIQDVRPLWGYENEADPVVVARKIDAATAAGVNVFIYDWYWYGGRPFLEDALNKGFLGAKNCERMKFYIMYANHAVGHGWDNKVGVKGKCDLVWSAKISDEDWRTIVARWIKQYFTRPNYYKIKGCPVVMIYDVNSFVKWDGEAVAKERIAYLRSEVKKAGFPNVHLQLNLCRDVDLGADSMTIYNWRDTTRERVDSATEPELTYREWGEMAMKDADDIKAVAAKAGAVYFPHISVGWDTNARYPKNERRPIVHGSNPADFEDFARRVKVWADANIPADMPKLITVNSWNEWTEGGYLEPGDKFGYGYLNALERVFVK